MTIENITSLATRLISLRDEVNITTQYLQELKLQRDSLQYEMLGTMQSENLLQYKVPNWTVSRTIRKDIAIIDESELIQQLKERDLEKDYVYPKLDTLKFKTLWKALAEKWDILNGTTISETEFISIRSSKK